MLKTRRSEKRKQRGGNAPSTIKTEIGGTAGNVLLLLVFRLFFGRLVTVPLLLRPFAFDEFFAIA
jgi:hypothetical protein